MQEIYNKLTKNLTSINVLLNDLQAGKTNVKSLLSFKNKEELINSGITEIESAILYGSFDDKKLMEKSHSEFANKKLSIQTVMRQQNIVNKLLDAENAETERDTDDKRESTTAKNIDGKTPKNFQEDITFEKNMDVLKQTNLKLNSFYKAKFDEYLNRVNNVSNE